MYSRGWRRAMTAIGAFILEWWMWIADAMVVVDEVDPLVNRARILRIRPRFLLLAPQWQLLDMPRDLQLQSSNDKEVCVWCQNFVGLNLTSFLPHTPGRKPCTLAKGWDVGKAFILSSIHKATLALRVVLQKEWAHGPVELNKKTSRQKTTKWPINDNPLVCPSPQLNPSD
jgi:hypothetical protein